MTAQADDTPNIVDQFLTALRATTWTDLTVTALVAAKLADATRAGWTIPQLVTWCTRSIPERANGGVITHRLCTAADTTPPTTGPTAGPARPFCTPQCEDAAGWVLDPDTLTPLRRCTCRTTKETP